MRTLFHGRWSVVIGFAAAFLFLAGVNAWLWEREIDISPLETATVSGTPPAKTYGANSLPLTTQLDLPETLTRPLFSPTRRDFVAPQVVPKPIVEMVEEVEETPQTSAKAAPPAARLRGTRVVDGRLSALIAINEKSADWYGEGETLQGWTITSIAPDRMSLTSGSQSVALYLFEPVKVDLVDPAE